MASNTTHPKRSVAGAAEHEQQHYSTDDDALAGRAFCGSTTPARGSGQTRYESLNDRIKQMLREDPILWQMLDKLLRDE
ncbi:MAG TPA: hypothetical protein O0X45_05315 [Methanocorpusculum sp.]|nr:hypothetical protein [Methanocorpusculum sp.]